MLDWMADQYTVFVTNILIFLENPTGCPWIESLHGPAMALGAILVARFVYLMIRARRFGQRGSTAHPLHDSLAKTLARASLSMEALGRSPLWSWRLRSLRKRLPVRVVESETILLCNVGLLRPTILVSSRAAQLLDDEQMEAALAHELTHILYFDNLKRTILEAVCLVLPVLTWWVGAGRLLTASMQAFLGLTWLGVALGHGYQQSGAGRSE